ncbi:MAG: cytochrome c [Pseudomonadales bacterium]|nr:cytochrome c [Pseudomonadales bacterium]
MNRAKALGLVVIGAAVAMGGCSKSDDYAPEAGADGKAMFETACIGCHAPISEGIYFELTADKAKPAVIAEKITKGNIAMPGFPNIKGEQLESLSLYVISASKVN